MAQTIERFSASSVQFHLVWRETCSSSCPHPHTNCPGKSPTFGSKAYRFPGPLDTGLHRLWVGVGGMLGSTLEAIPAPSPFYSVPWSSWQI